MSQKKDADFDEMEMAEKNEQPGEEPTLPVVGDDGVKQPSKETTEDAMSQKKDADFDEMEMAEKHGQPGEEPTLPVVGDDGVKQPSKETTEGGGPSYETVTTRQLYAAWFVSDVLLYVTVLNLAAEWVKSIIITSFGFSILAALILKLFLDLIMHIEHFFKHKCCEERNWYILGALSMWLIVFGSKFIILWIDDVIFQGWVELGGFINILVLAVTLMVLERLSRFLFDALGKPWTASLDCWAKSVDYTEEALALSWSSSTSAGVEEAVEETTNANVVES